MLHAEHHVDPEYNILPAG